MNDTVISFLGAVQYPVFSPYLDILQNCRDDDELYRHLITAMEQEPYLLARMVNLANSVYFGSPNTYFYSATDCLQRVGLLKAMQVAMTFFLEAPLKPLASGDSRMCRQTWQEAVLAAQISNLFNGYCEEPFSKGGAFLATALSYLGELYVVSLVPSKMPSIPPLGVYSRPKPGELDIYQLTKTILQKLELPRPVDEAITAVGYLEEANNAPVIRNASVITLSRAIAQYLRLEAKGEQAGFAPSIAAIDEALLDQSVFWLGLNESDLDAFYREARVFKANPLPLGCGG